MKNSANSQRGQALLIFVFVIIILVGIAGLAIDGSQVFGPDRRPQFAADAAALGAALCHNRGNKAWTQCAYDIAAGYGYDNDLVSNRVEAYTCDMVQASCASYTGNRDYIQVILTTYRETPLTRLLTNAMYIRQRERVEAIAPFQPPDKVALWRSDSPIAGMGRTWVFSAPTWLQSIPEPYRLVLLILIGVMILGLPLLIRRIRVKPVKRS